MHYILRGLIGIMVLMGAGWPLWHWAQLDENTPEVTLAEVQQEVSEAVEVTSIYAFQQGAAAYQEMERQLRYIETQLERWHPVLEKAGKEAQVTLQRQIAELEGQRHLLQQRLNQLKQPTHAAWNDIAVGFRKAFRELGRASSKALRRFTVS